MHSILANLVEEEINCKKEKKVKELKRKVGIIEEEKREIEEKHDMESVTINAIEQLIHDLNEDYMRCIETATVKIKKIKYENYAKLNQKDQAIKRRAKEHKH